ncbi:MAG: HAD family phosphatase [Rhodobiaceae bacterium]|nr:HAD family phosphatase [Rhodobiaceae bacterium]MCC0057480.1 HAD family phosphatase [Rhodobiaceae bacterium]
MSAIRSIVFDVGHVLIDWQPVAFFRTLIADPERHAFFAREVVPLSWHGEQDRGRPIAQAVAERQAEYPEFAEQIAAYYDRWLETIPGAIDGMPELIQDLRASGYPIHAITNFSAELWPMTVEAYPFLGAFDTAVVSGEVGLIKPDPAIYRVLLDRTGDRPEQCVFIDDRQANIDAAAALGFDAIRFVGQPALRHELEERGLLRGSKTLDGGA